MESPVVMTTFGVVHQPLDGGVGDGLASARPNPAGWRFELRAIERRS
jgi:hypothetical protein